MIFTKVDFDRPGKHQGFLQLPYSYNLGAWANLLIPVTVIKNGVGPTALLLAGTHGNEYQGQIAIMNLAHELESGTVSGCLIMIPSLNLPAAKAGARLSPLDGKNLNRAFPGAAEGTATEQIADYLRRVLFPLADIVIDIHSGGRTLTFVPCCTMDVVPDKEQRKKIFEGVMAWNADFLLLYLNDIAGTGLLPVEAERQGKIVITTEMGGGELIPAAVHRMTQSGLRNVLVHFGLIEGKEETRQSLGKPPATIVHALSRDDYLLAEASGIFEATADLGSYVRAGQVVGRLHSIEQPSQPPGIIKAQTDGYLISFRAPTLTQQGDCVAVVAQKVEPQAVLDM